MSGASAALPLAGRRIVVTRPREQAFALAALLEAAGATVLATPTIAIEAPESWAPLDRALAELHAYRWVVFTSANGVAMVRQRLAAHGRSVGALSRCRVAAIGPATAAALTAWGAAPEVVPDAYVAEDLGAHLAARVEPGDRVLLPRAAEARDVLVRALEAAGARVDEVAAYRTRPAGAGDLRAALRSQEVDMVTFTSSSTVRHFAALFAPGELPALMSGVAVACIGPITGETAITLGLRPEVVADEYTIPGLARAIIRHAGAGAPGAPAPDPEAGRIPERPRSGPGRRGPSIQRS